jgi:Penicillin binding protein transpeptidase domain
VRPVSPAAPDPASRRALRRARRRRLVLRAILWSVPLAVGVAASLAVARAREDADVGRAAALVILGQPSAARPFLKMRAGSRRVGARARAGLAVLAALDGRPAPEGFGDADLAAFRPAIAMDDALRRGDFEACRRVARLARSHGDAVAAGYEAAALLEGGDPAGASALLAAVPGLAARHPGRRLARVLDARAAGATLTVADRRGALAGFLDDRGSFHPEAGGPADWVPPAALDAVKAVRRGAGVRLSADFDLSAMALAALGSYRGTVVLIDLATGEVLAAVSDARTRAEGGTPAFDQLREPASILKIVTTSAALRAKHDADAEVSRMVCEGARRYQGGTLWCSAPHGPLTGLKEAFAVSCNIAFANLAVELGWPSMVDELHRWGFDRAASELPGAGHVLKTEGTERELASLGVGLDLTDVTPVHAALIASVLAGGVMPRPALVSAQDGALALSPRAIAPAPARRIMDLAWVKAMAEKLEGVVEEGGTAEGAVPPSFPVTMKTGTAAAPGVGYHVNYVGVGPRPRPRLAFCVRVTHQPTSHHARDAGYEVLSRLLADLGRRRW